MGRVALCVVLTGSVFAGASFGQAMTEFGAAAAGGSIGAAGGKSLSNGINSIFGKVDQQMGKAAKADAPAMTVAPGVPKNADGGVPLPPPAAVSAPVSRTPVRREPDPPQAAVQIPFTVGVLSDALPSEPLPPPPAMSPEDLKTVTTGMSRADLLRLGIPSSKITTIEDGHMVESYSYRENHQRFGGVKLTDGVVTSVQAQ
jgi:hypothetical protein